MTNVPNNMFKVTKYSILEKIVSHYYDEFGVLIPSVESIIFFKDIKAEVVLKSGESFVITIS